MLLIPTSPDTLYDYLATKFPVKTKDVDFKEFRMLTRRFKDGICQISIVLKDPDDRYDSYNKQPYIMIYYKERIISEFLIGSPSELDIKICEIANHIPDFKSDVRNIKLDMLV